MRSSIALAKHLLSATLLATLVLGLLVRPVLNQLSDLHAVEHAMQDHPEAQSHDRAVHHFYVDHALDGDHAHGTHVLMHSGDGNVSANFCAMPVVPVHLPTAVLVAAPYLGVEPALPPVSVFRPPIV